MAAHDPHPDARLLGRYLRPERRPLAALVALLLVAMLLPLAGPLLIGWFVDAALRGEPASLVAKNPGVGPRKNRCERVCAAGQGRDRHVIQPDVRTVTGSPIMSLVSTFKRPVTLLTLLRMRSVKSFSTWDTE